MTVMVTGGAGYIGSHVVRLLERCGDDVVILDDLSNGFSSRAGRLPLVDIDLCSAEAQNQIADVIQRYGVDSVIHFAAKKQVGESVERPLWYYRQNVTGLGNLLQAVGQCGVAKVVFSSSAAAYGMPDIPVVGEDVPCRPINPYGETKLIGEWMLRNAARATGLRTVSLRYFNVAGAGWPDLADKAALNLIPIVINRLTEGKNPVVFGDTYDTPDGTCVRDYVHVVDLAEAHIKALDFLDSDACAPSVFNVGTGTGASVLEVIDSIGQVSGLNVIPDISAARPGDPAQLVADVSRIEAELGWKAQYGLPEIVESAWAAQAL
ncbi:UDP-glucose 4-epimerase GalE [Saxibacter everestensis]|uniref:UDP-glucose 4-epimerase n=1 Tax=Saxibacter everestensis TaxID=2909229 RepID=A0ABY8QTP4_9MICO|nr:UDP-glucose 4-epimerase GalE [Brevibacteriaceae bacterium ZFBP1038]